jgi:hypothetical protein
MLLRSPPPRTRTHPQVGLETDEDAKVNIKDFSVPAPPRGGARGGK